MNRACLCLHIHSRSWYSERLLRRCLRHRRSSATAISTSSPAGCAMSLTQYTRLSCFFCRRTNCLTRFHTNWETTVKTAASSSHWKHWSSVSISVSSALKVYLYTTMRYINRRFTYLLTYLLNTNRHTLCLMQISNYVTVCSRTDCQYYSFTVFFSHRTVLYDFYYLVNLIPGVKWNF